MVKLSVKDHKFWFLHLLIFCLFIIFKNHNYIVEKYTVVKCNIGSENEIEKYYVKRTRAVLSNEYFTMCDNDEYLIITTYFFPRPRLCIGFNNGFQYLPITSCRRLSYINKIWTSKSLNNFSVPFQVLRVNIITYNTYNIYL